MGAHQMSINRLILFVLVCATLAGCDAPVGLASAPIIKGYQSDQSSELEARARAAFLKETAFSQVKISISQSNDLSDFYSTRYSVLLAGEFANISDHSNICHMLPQILILPPDKLLIADLISVGGVRTIDTKLPKCVP